ncbi:unnamed protein product, partial [Closterium sp. Naga37s-1]
LVFVRWDFKTSQKALEGDSGGFDNGQVTGGFGGGQVSGSAQGGLESSQPLLQRPWAKQAVTAQGAAGGQAVLDCRRPAGGAGALCCQQTPWQ